MGLENCGTSRLENRINPRLYKIGISKMEEQRYYRYNYSVLGIGSKSMRFTSVDRRDVERIGY